MLNCLNRNQPIYYNRSLRDYCMESTKKSIQKHIIKQDLERNNSIIHSKSSNFTDDFFKICFFLSITSLAIYFGKRF